MEDLKSPIGHTAIIRGDGILVIFGEHFNVKAKTSCQGLELKIVAPLAQPLHALEIFVKDAIDIFGLWWWFIDVACGSRGVAPVSAINVDGDEIFELISEVS